MSLFLLLIPVGLLLYSFWRVIRQPVFLISIVFFQVIGAGLFFDRIRPLWAPAKLLPPPLIIFSWLILLLFLYYTLTYTEFARSGFKQILFPFVPPYDYIVLALFVLWCFSFVSSLLLYSGDADVVWTGLTYLTMFGGYFFLRNLFIKTPSKNFEDFLNFIVLVNYFVLVVFITDRLLNLQALSGVSYIVYDQGDSILRTFLPSNFFWLGMSYAFSRKRWGVINVAGVIISAVAAILGGTRSLLLIALLLFVLSVFLQLIKKSNSKYWVGRTLAMLVTAGLLVAAATIFFQENTSYVLERINQPGMFSIDNSDSTLSPRISAAQDIMDLINKDTPLLGVGFKEYPVGHTNGISYNLFADGEWLAVLWRYGYAGVVLFALLYFWSLFESLKHYFFSTDEMSSYWLMVFLLVVASALFGLVTWTIHNDGQYYVLALLPFTLLSVGLFKSKRRND